MKAEEIRAAFGHNAEAEADIHREEPSAKLVPMPKSKCPVCQEQESS